MSNNYQNEKQKNKNKTIPTDFLLCVLLFMLQVTGVLQEKKGGIFPKSPAINKSSGVEVALLVGRNKHVSNYFSLQCRAGRCWSQSEDSVFR